MKKVLFALLLGLLMGGLSSCNKLDDYVEPQVNPLDGGLPGDSVPPDSNIPIGIPL